MVDETWRHCQHEWTFLDDDEDDEYRLDICSKCGAYLHQDFYEGTVSIEEPNEMCIDDEDSESCLL